MDAKIRLTLTSYPINSRFRITTRFFRFLLRSFFILRWIYHINNINSHTDVTSFIPLFILFMLFEILFEFPPLWRWPPSLMKVWWHFTWIILLFCLYSACIRDERTFYWKSHNMKSSELSITKIWFFDLIKSGFYAFTSILLFMCMIFRFCLLVSFISRLPVCLSMS